MGKGVAKTTSRDRGKAHLLRELEKLRGRPYAKIGVIGSEAKAAKADGEAGLTVVDVAVFNEFGTEDIPERSFIRSTAISKRSAWRALQNKFQAKFLRSRGSFDILEILKIVGTQAQADIQKRITDIKSPPNAPSTQLKKGRKVDPSGNTKINNPLIDTGQLRQSITYKVVKG